MVLDAHAVIKPWTMMIEPFNASVADGAVARTRRPQNATVWTHLTRMDLREQFEEVVLLAKIAGVAHRRHKVGDRDNRAQTGDQESQVVVRLL